MPRSNNQSQYEQFDDQADSGAERRNKSRAKQSNKAMRRRSRSRATNDPILGMSARRSRRWTW